MKFALLHAYFHYKMDGTTYRNDGIVSPESRYRRAGLVAQLGPEYSGLMTYVKNMELKACISYQRLVALLSLLCKV